MLFWTEQQIKNKTFLVKKKVAPQAKEFSSFSPDPGLKRNWTEETLAVPEGSRKDWVVLSRQPTKTPSNGLPTLGGRQQSLFPQWEAVTSSAFILSHHGGLLTGVLGFM